MTYVYVLILKISQERVDMWAASARNMLTSHMIEAGCAQLGSWLVVATVVVRACSRELKENQEKLAETE